MSDDFPSSKLQRGKIIAKTGLKVGSNYAKYYAERTLSGKKKSEVKQKLDAANANDVYQELTKLRGTALKLAQGLSMDTGFLPDEFVDMMSNAQYRVPPMNKALVRTSIKRELGSYPEQLFKKFNLDAIAAASIGQVHEAILNDGRKVAVKIQYPDIRNTIKSDLGIAKTIFRRLVSSQNIDMYFDEVYDKLLEETDYMLEKKQMEFFSGLYTDERIVTPEPVEELTSERVLTMTFLEGVHLDKFLESSPTQEQKNHFGQLMWDWYHRQIANEQYTIHADIHPGNFIFQPDGNLGIVDFGCVKTFPPEFLQLFIQMIPAHLSGDEKRILELYYGTEILHPSEAGTEEHEIFFQFSKDFGGIILRPYQGDSFDFGDQQFKADLNEQFKKASTFKEVRGSKHFIFLNKVVVGMYTLLMKLKPVIDMRYSFRVMEEAIDRHVTT
ncbi:MAG: ABC1 kinase family protein [Calditrichia bacterium]